MGVGRGGEGGGFVGRGRREHARLGTLDLNRILDAPANAGNDDRALVRRRLGVHIAGGRRVRRLSRRGLIRRRLGRGFRRKRGREQRRATSTGQEQGTARTQ